MDLIDRAQLAWQRQADDALRRRIDRATGCLLGGAVGDALGAPIEFLSRAEIERQFGPGGLRDFAPAFGRVGAVTDDTQMSLFTAEGLLRAYVRTVRRGIGPVFAPMVDLAYGRWMHTQGERAGFDKGGPRHKGWLITHQALFARRAPGTTCLSALRAKEQAGVPAGNDSKGCGGVMRVAPVGVFAATAWGGQSQAHRDQRTFDLGCEIAGLTHGHGSGRLPAGVMAVLTGALCGHAPWDDALARARVPLLKASDGDETVKALDRAIGLARREPGQTRHVESLGEGWVAEEALAIAVYCAHSALAQAKDGVSTFEEGVALAVHHGGDSDSTGALTGHLLGAALGHDAVPARWLEALELREVIEEVAQDLATFTAWALDDGDADDEAAYWWGRYPGG